MTVILVTCMTDQNRYKKSNQCSTSNSATDKLGNSKSRPPSAAKEHSQQPCLPLAGPHQLGSHNLFWQADKMALLRRAINNLSESSPLFILSKANSFRPVFFFRVKWQEHNEILTLVYRFTYSSFMNFQMYCTELFFLQKAQQQHHRGDPLKTNTSTHYVTYYITSTHNRNGQTQRDQKLTALNEKTTLGRFERKNKSSPNSLSSKAPLNIPPESCCLFGSKKNIQTSFYFLFLNSEIKGSNGAAELNPKK